MKETIFYLEGRGGNYFYHFFVLNLGGLFYIVNNVFNNRGSDNTSLLFNDKSKVVEKPANYNIIPIKIYMNDVLPFQREAFEIIKDKFELVEDLSNVKDYEIVSIYGETCNNGYSDNQNMIFPFLRFIFLKQLNYEVIPGQRIFITRKNSESQHSGVLKRYIFNVIF
jgi:hypothetical protein